MRPRVFANGVIHLGSAAAPGRVLAGVLFLHCAPRLDGSLDQVRGARSAAACCGRIKALHAFVFIVGHACGYRFRAQLLQQTPELACGACADDRDSGGDSVEYSLASRCGFFAMRNHSGSRARTMAACGGPKACAPAWPAAGTRLNRLDHDFYARFYARGAEFFAVFSSSLFPCAARLVIFAIERGASGPTRAREFFCIISRTA